MSVGVLQRPFIVAVNLFVLIPHRETILHLTLEMYVKRCGRDTPLDLDRLNNLLAAIGQPLTNQSEIDGREEDVAVRNAPGPPHGLSVGANARYPTARRVASEGGHPGSDPAPVARAPRPTGRREEILDHLGAVLGKVPAVR